jgi:hypothetical protein
MTFPIKGESHSNGIKNEKNVVNYLKNNPTNSITKHLEKNNGYKIIEFNHQGGTKKKMDASYQLENGKCKGVSIKNYMGGTFDWINTTLGVPKHLKEEIIKFKNKNLDTIIPEKGGIRDDLDNIFSVYLDKLTSKDITELLSKIYKTEENTDTIIINETKKKELIMIHESNLDPYCNPTYGHKFILKSTSKAKTSRQIWIKSADGFEINTNLRVRLLLNNGITALLGKSKKNKSSVPCLKIQQDNINIFINKCFGKVIAKY